MSRDFLEMRVAALAAGELSDREAQPVRREVARDPELARFYREQRRLQRALRLRPEEGVGPDPALRERILAATLPEFRRLYRRRTAFWPAWFTAAAAVLLVFMVQPPPVRGALDALPRAARGLHRLQAEASRRTDRVLAELSVFRASFGVALEDRLDRMGDRLREVERATRRRDQAAPGHITSPSGNPETQDQDGGTAR